MRAHYLQHVPFEDLGSIESWLSAAGAEITSTRFFEQGNLPNLEEIDLLVVMGGPMSANDEEKCPWLAAEKLFIRDAIWSDIPVLGVCLGAQLIANALGSRVYQNREKEIGWFPVHRIPSSGSSNFCFPPSVEVFHWHGETFDLPPDATRLARSEGCENQAFQLGRAVIGLQFHLETTPESAKRMIAQGRSELLPSKYVQSEATILAASPEKYQEIKCLMGEVLFFLTGLPRGGRPESAGNLF